jgi:superfamily II DNA or RNA helicase
MRLSQITYIEQIAVAEAFSVQDPKARFYNSDTDGIIHKYHEKSGLLSRGFLTALHKLCVQKGFPLEVVDTRSPCRYFPPPVETVTDAFLDGITLEKYQLRALHAACDPSVEIGLFEFPTGSGKSELIAGLVKLYNCPTVVIADQLIIIDQLARRLKLRKVVEDVGLFMAGVRPNGQIVVVGSIQSLAIPSLPDKKDHDTDESYIKKLNAHETRTKNAKKLRDIIGRCDLCLIDEADKATSPQYQKLLRYWFKGRRRFGFSGTLFDPESPVENLKLRENLGEILATAERSEVQAQNRIIPVTYTALAIGNYKDRYNRVTYDVAEKQSIAENEQLHKIIANIVSRQVAANPKAGILIIIDKIEVGTNLQNAISGSVFLHGGTTKKQRPKIIKDFEERKINVLIGSKILRRGLDLSGGCEVLINATGGKRWSEFVQLVGRAVRLNAAGICHIYDFYFLTNHYLYEHSRKRIKHIVGLGYAARVVFPHCAIDAVKFEASKFRIPKH